MKLIPELSNILNKEYERVKDKSHLKKKRDPKRESPKRAFRNQNIEKKKKTKN